MHSPQVFQDSFVWLLSPGLDPLPLLEALVVYVLLICILSEHSERYLNFPHLSVVGASHLAAEITKTHPHIKKQKSVMKRSLPPDYNPVYPFGTKRLNLMPPFFNSQGFTDEAPDATLSLNIERPLSYTPQGALQLAVGRGFVIRNGILETNDLSSSVIPPLVRDNNNLVTLAVAGGLIVSQDALAVNPGMGLEINNHGVLVPKAAAPLQLSAADGLTLSFGDGLQAAGGALTPVLGDGLEIRD